ncbi:hypothetical protein CVIRNUC_001324 [Coccomyxa viridis]|uniref:Uncharacterized protein n=1 Tax=Coccomyxa viridis TaxID=1274662 RepID=A0AAV1HVM1_9CHLO|nr:hypothetical protein CVIRNUC_001324 [Coccomyxa viridis]
MADGGISDPRVRSLFQTGPQKQAPAFHADEKALKELQDTFGYGQGFLSVCLAYCGNDAQQVADMLLEEDLPDALARLDKSMPIPPDRGHHAPLVGDPRAAWMNTGVERLPKRAAGDSAPKAQTDVSLKP